jgi:hypothetical protein
MIETLADIEALVLRCRAENSREYISEAVLCYRSGAYRSTIVNVWIAVVFDLIDKVRDLARAGDGNAQALNTRYETYLAQINDGNEQGVRKALEFERDILATCRDSLQLFDHQQYRDLLRLREDRHQCAHPSFQSPGEPYRPSAEQARLHLRNAVLHVLSQPPVQGRAAIAELVSLVGSAYFPVDTPTALTALGSSPLATGTEPLVRGFVDALVFGYVDPASSLRGKAQVPTALEAALHLHRPVIEQRLALQLSKLVRDLADPDFPRVVRLVALTPAALNLIDQPARIRLGEFVRTGPIREVVKSLAALSIHPDLEPAVRTRVQTLDLERLAEGIAVFGLREPAKDRALTLLSAVRQWETANDVFARCVMPIFDSLTRDDIERVIRMPTETNADLPGANGYSTFLDHVRRSQIIPDADLDALLAAHGAGYLLPQNEPGT